MGPMALMGMTMGMTIRQRQEPVQRQAMTQAQVLAVRMTIRMELLQAIWGSEYGDQFKVDEQCPSCRARLTLEEILKGFSAEPTDTFSTCPRCKARFQPQLRGLRTQSGDVELAFYCECQTLHALQGKENVPFAELVMTAYGRSALIHFGSLTKAFATMGVKYTAEAEKRKGWQDRIATFLGRVPDTLIATVVGVSAKTVQKYRRERGVGAFSGYENADE